MAPDGRHPLRLRPLVETDEPQARLAHEELALMGGHIGYLVRPPMRRRGHATAALRAALPVARSLGIDPALVTWADDNLASITVVERCGGRLLDVGPAPGTGRPTRRYQLATG